MAELSTIARPYAEALIEALQDRKAGAEEMARVLETLDQTAQAASDPRVLELAGDPKVTDDQVFALIEGILGQDAPSEVKNLLQLVVSNRRMEAMPEIARQFRDLKNAADGVADAIIETAFPLDDAEVAELMAALAKKFPGVKLHPVVTVDKNLIGGVRVHVGDKLLDASIRARLEQMKTTLTA